MNQPSEKQNFKFDVFISYRHSDLDSAAAAYLHKAMENYKIPKEIQEKTGKTSISRVFRDEEELGAASDLFTEIENNLKQSEYLLVVLSPRYKQSKWCLKEIETFLRYRSRDNILAVIIEGEPYDVFPEILLQDGEPLAMDLRAKDKKEMLKLAKERLPRLIAPVLGCTYDELYQRHRVYRMRRIAALSAIVAAISLVFGVVTIKQNIEINRNYKAKLENQSRYLAQTAGDLMQSGDRETALLIALEALPKSAEDTSRPYVAEARIALENALYTYHLDNYFNLKPQKILPHKATAYLVSDYNAENDVMLTTDYDGRVYIWRADTGTNIFTSEGSVYINAALRGNGFIAQDSTGLSYTDYTTGQTVWQWPYPRCNGCYSPDYSWRYNRRTDKIICINNRMQMEYDHTFTTPQIYDGHCIQVIDAATGVSRSYSPQDYFADHTSLIYGTYHVENMAISPDGSHVALMVFNKEPQQAVMEIYVYHTGGTQAVYTRSLPATNSVVGLHWLDNSRIVTVTSPDASPLTGSLESPFTLEMRCADISTGRQLFDYTDRCMSLEYGVKMENYTSLDGTNTPVDQFYIMCGNLLLTVDSTTGTVYSRMEDRSRMRLAFAIPDSRIMMVITADGYVFITNPLQDRMYSPLLTANHYYLDVGNITKIRRYNDRTYLFTDADVHWYQDQLDMSLTFFDSAPDSCGFSGSSQYMYTVNYDDTLSVYDTQTKEKIFSDTLLNAGGDRAVMAQDNLLAYITPRGDRLAVYDIAQAEKTVYEIPGVLSADGRKGSLYLRAGRAKGNLITLYTNMSHIVSPSADNSQKILWAADISDGSVKLSLTLDDLISRFPQPDKLKYIQLYTAALSGDEKYIVIAGTATYLTDDGSLSSPFVFSYSCADNSFVPLNAEVVANTHPDSFAYTTDGWLCPGNSIVNFFGADRNIRFVNLADGSLLHTLVTDGGVASSEVSFTPDGDHVIFQDSSGRLKVYNWKKAAYTMEEAVAENGSLSFDFYNDGQLLSAHKNVAAWLTQVTQLYNKTADGVYTLDNAISGCIGCDGKTTVISENNLSRFYTTYTLDDLLTKAREILGDRQLTEAERQTYLTD